MNAGQDNTMIAIHESALSKIGDVLITLQDETIKRMSDALEAAEARVKELEHDLEVDDWHAAFVKAEAERDNERKEREALYPVIDGKNRAIKSLSTDVLKMQRINGELLTERDEARRQLSEAQHAIDVLSNTVVAQDATIKQLEQARSDIEDYRAEIARLNQAATA